MAGRGVNKPPSEADSGRKGPTSLDQVDRRRYQLWSTSLFLVVAVTLAIAVVVLGRPFLPEAFRVEQMATWVIVVLITGLAFAFLIYVVEKERNLRQLRDLLVEERVLSAALSNRLSEISALTETGKALNTTLNVGDVLDLILSSALELLGGTEGSVMLVDEAGQNLEVVTYQGPRQEAVMKGKTRVGHGISGSVAASRKALLMQGDVGGELEGAGHPERGIRSSMSVPLVRRDELLGVLNLNETEGKRIFSNSDLSALGLFAEHAAIALGNARLFEKEKEAVVRLEELDRMKSDFLATVSHELKTPLTSILGAAKTLSRKYEGMEPAQRASFLEMIERQGTNLLHMVEDVLTAARIESGLPKMRRELVDLRDLADLVLDDLRHSSVGMERSLSLETSPERPRVWGDLRSIQQILANLVENALKYTDGSVRVRIEESPREALIEVSDEGPGLGSEQLAVIFDRFRQVDNSATRSVGGVGLGLFIVKNLSEAHNGNVEVESEEGVGTTFRVHLPKRARDQ